MAFVYGGTTNLYGIFTQEKIKYFSGLGLGLRLGLRLGFAGLRLLGLAGLWFLLGLACFGLGFGVVLHDRVDGQPLAGA